uniref:Uncharacterized protein n=1 Tax=Cacopsylla melanoneura TaxID=428564 RepID=A0A8D8YV96_9HEMI
MVVMPFDSKRCVLRLQFSLNPLTKVQLEIASFYVLSNEMVILRLRVGQVYVIFLLIFFFFRVPIFSCSENPFSFCYKVRKQLILFMVVYFYFLYLWNQNYYIFFF